LQFAAVLSLGTLPAVKFCLGDVLEVVGRFHVELLILGRWRLGSLPGRGLGDLRLEVVGLCLLLFELVVLLSEAGHILQLLGRQGDCLASEKVALLVHLCVIVEVPLPFLLLALLLLHNLLVEEVAVVVLVTLLGL
jgi:hypothetical protein